jgi:hypothetical protein
LLCVPLGARSEGMASATSIVPRGLLISREFCGGFSAGFPKMRAIRRIRLRRVRGPVRPRVRRRSTLSADLARRDAHRRRCRWAMTGSSAGRGSDLSEVAQCGAGSGETSLTLGGDPPGGPSTARTRCTCSAASTNECRAPACPDGHSAYRHLTLRCPG